MRALANGCRNAQPNEISNLPEILFGSVVAHLWVFRRSAMKWPDILDILDRSSHRYATVEDVRRIFADYHDALHWLAGFLIGDKLAPACVIDACNIAGRQGPVFHEWLAHWAARATLRSALQMQRGDVAELAPTHERFEGVDEKRSPLSPEDLQLLIEESDALRARLDILCRFVLVMHGIAKESCEEVAAQLGVSQSAVERAYCVAFDTLHLVSKRMLCNADIRVMVSQ
jgi:DNA-directed RNA polymerase specialized sigma24 family protein